MTELELVAFDLDGTILEAGETIAPECVAAIRRLHALGIRCVINSGRSTAYQAELLVGLGLLDHFDGLIGDERWIKIIQPGTAGAGAGGDQVVSLEPWNNETARRWQSLEPEAGRLCRDAEQEAQRRGWAIRTIGREESLRRGLWAVRFEDPAHSVAMFRWLEPRMADGLAVNCNGGYVHVYDALCDKGTSLAALAEHFGIPAASVLTFGDNVNDRPMLDGRHGFASATVANADAEVQRWVRDAGGRVARQSRGAGVAELLAETVGDGAAKTAAR